MDVTNIASLDRESELLTLAIESLDEAFDAVAKATYPNTPADAQSIRDIQISLTERRGDVAARRAAIVWGGE
jgi:hypothetical protein